MRMKKVKIEKPVFEISDKDVNEALANLAKANKTRKPKGDKAKAIEMAKAAFNASAANDGSGPSVTGATASGIFFGADD